MSNKYGADLALEVEAKALFDADPSSKYEADWFNLAPYKRADWREVAKIKRLQESS